MPSSSRVCLGRLGVFTTAAERHAATAPARPSISTTGRNSAAYRTASSTSPRINAPDCMVRLQHWDPQQQLLWNRPRDRRLNSGWMKYLAHRTHAQHQMDRPKRWLSQQKGKRGSRGRQANEQAVQIITAFRFRWSTRAPSNGQRHLGQKGRQRILSAGNRVICCTFGTNSQLNGVFLNEDEQWRIDLTKKQQKLLKLEFKTS